MAEETMAEVVNYCGLVKTSHKSFCLAILENLTKDWQGGSYLVMKIDPIVPGSRPLLSIGCKYNSRKVLGFIDIEGGGINEPGDPYVYYFPAIYSNVSVCPVVRHHFLGRCFNACNAIYNNNRMQKSGLALEKYWLAQGGYFRLATKVALCMGITDGKLLYCHGILEESMDKTIQHWSTTTGRFITYLVIPLQLILESQI